MVAKLDTVLKLPRRPTTVERYLKILKFALGRNRDVEAVARHFGCSTATVINATKAFGVTYDQIRRRRTLPQLRVAEEYVRVGRKLNERDQQVIDLYNSPGSLTLQAIGQRIGLTRQRVHQILRNAKHLGVRLASRQAPAEGHWIERCATCTQILQMQAEEPLMTRRQIGQRLSVPIWIVHWHLSKLKACGLLQPHFGYFRSERLIEAIKQYNANAELSAWKLGRELGYKNLPGIFAELHKRGLGYLLVSHGKKPRTSTTGGGKVIYAADGFQRPVCKATLETAGDPDSTQV
jgi:hypothetical protein